MITGNVNVKRVDTTAQYNLGDEFHMGGGAIARYIKYNDGDGNVAGCRGQICYPVVGNTSVPTYNYEVTVDLSSTTVPSQGQFAGVILADVILTGEFGWVQIAGANSVFLWADIAAIDRSTSIVTNMLMPAAAANENIAGDGIVGVSTEALDAAIFALLSVDVDGSPTLSTDRVFFHIPAGQVVEATPFSVGETVTGGTSSDTAVIVEILRRSGTQYGMIVSTVTSTYFHTSSETITGGTSGATGVITTKGEAVRACKLFRAA